MTEKRALIDTLMDRTGLDPYKLKRLSKNELEQLVAAYKEDEKQFQEMYKTMDDLYETIVVKDALNLQKDEEISEKEEVILEKEEALKPENYLSTREQSDRQLNKITLEHMNYLWEKITGQSEIPNIYVFVVFGTVICLIYVVAFYGLFVMPIIYFSEILEWLFGK